MEAVTVVSFLASADPAALSPVTTAVDIYEASVFTVVAVEVALVLGPPTLLAGNLLRSVEAV
jgi:hypothetical protein